MPDKPSSFVFRAPSHLRLGYRVHIAHTRANLRKIEWLVRAVEEKCDREGVTLESLNKNDHERPS